MMRTKNRPTRFIRRDTKNEKDRLSELSDSILLHIMSFMDTTDAVHTSVLSKRWRDLWKRVNSLSFQRMYFRTSIANYNKFVSQVLSRRYSSIPLQSLDFEAEGSTAPKLVNKVMEYVVSHDVPQLTIDVDLSSVTIPDFSIPFIFSYPSLAFLKLSIRGRPLKIPYSLQLPALKGLYLQNVNFTAEFDQCAEPFSNCNLLNTLILENCSLYQDAEVLCISNSNLSSLTIDSTYQKSYRILLSTPNISSLTVQDTGSFQKIETTDDLSFLEEVNIDVFYNIDFSEMWWKLLANAKRMTLSWRSLNKLLEGHDHMGIQNPRTPPPCFVRLESLKMEMYQDLTLSDEQIAMAAEYILQNTPPARVAVIPILNI